MKKKIELEIGRTYNPRDFKSPAHEDVIIGSGCKAERTRDTYLLKIQAARHGGGVDAFEILEIEFSKLKTGQLSFKELIQKYTE